jgi:hypothetical protein
VFGAAPLYLGRDRPAVPQRWCRASGKEQRVPDGLHSGSTPGGDFGAPPAFGSPMGGRPFPARLSISSWQDAAKAMFLGRVSVLHAGGTEVHSTGTAMRLPSVLAPKEYIPAARRPAFTQFDLFLRDRFACQSCGADGPAPDIAFHHATSRRRSGGTTWLNFSMVSQIISVVHQRVGRTICSPLGGIPVLQLLRGNRKEVRL